MKSILFPTLALAAFTGLPGLAQPRIECSEPSLTLPSRGTCTLTLAGADIEGRAWRWRLEDKEAFPGILGPSAPGKARFNAPALLAPRPFMVVVEEIVSGEEGPRAIPRAALHLQVVPGARPGTSERSLVDQLFPGAFTPSLGAFSLNPAPEEAMDPFALPWAEGLAFCEDKAMGRFHRTWLTAGVRGLEAWNFKGEAASIFEAAPDRHGCAVAALPPLPAGARALDPAPARRVVYADCLWYNQADHPGVDMDTRIFALKDDGAPEFLAGGPGGGCADGAGKEARFTSISALALAPDGVVYVGEHTLVRRIRRDGFVERWAGHWGLPPSGRIQDGRRQEVRFNPILSLVVDPATGDLYVGEEGAVRRITPEGVVSTLLGGPRPAAWGQGHEPAAPPVETKAPRAADPLEPPAPTPRDRIFPHSLALRGRELFISDGRACRVLAFNLDTGMLVRIVHSTTLGPSRLGPLPCLNPALGPAACASVSQIGPFAVSPEGMGLLVLEEGLAYLDLPDAPLTEVAAALQGTAPASRTP